LSLALEQQGDGHAAGGGPAQGVDELGGRVGGVADQEDLVVRAVDQLGDDGGGEPGGAQRR
jgi:hypothetical protein